MPLRLRPGRRRARGLVRRLPLLLSLAVLATVAIRPGLVTSLTDGDGTPPDSYSGFDADAAARLRQDECLMETVLRTGGPAMAHTAQNALDGSADQLHAAANQEYWNNSPLHQGFGQDRDATTAQADDLHKRLQSWGTPLQGLPTPSGFTTAGFAWPPGIDGQGKSFFDQAGLGPWLGDRMWLNEDGFYKDPTPAADKDTGAAVTQLGTPLYGSDPDPSLPTDQWRLATAEHDAWQKLTDPSFHPLWADDARILLASGGFPRSSPEPGSLPFRIAVEDLKSRFAACTWRNPIDPDKVLGQQVATASKEWQQEVSSQAAQRDAILTANIKATTALASGAKALGEALGQSWLADRLTQWQDYWAPGGPGAVGDGPDVFHLHTANGKCLDVLHSELKNGATVQVWDCNGSAAQQWKTSDYGDLTNVATGKCLDVDGLHGPQGNGTKVQIWDCNRSKSQKWQFTTKGATRLYNTGSGLCLDLHTSSKGQPAQVWQCNNSGPQLFDVETGNDGTHQLGYPTKDNFTQASKSLGAARISAKSQWDTIKAQAGIAEHAAQDTDTAEQQAYGVADNAGEPRGRGLLVGEQKAQVTKAAAAALEAMAKAAETAYDATRASGADSATIADRARAQAATAKAAFRTAAANEANEQAKAAAAGAAEQAKLAADQDARAHTALDAANKAEADAKAAAATAHAKRLAAESDEATAKADKETAAVKQAEAAQNKQAAQDDAAKAEADQSKAESAAATASSKRQAAEQADQAAKDARDQAWDAQQRRNALQAKARAKDAYAQAETSESDAEDAKSAAQQADQAADAAATDAANAQSAADKATKAAQEADAAATDAEAAAQRARADADAAKAAKLQADADVLADEKAAADAIATSAAASDDARKAQKDAADAEKNAADAKNQADQASAEAGKAVAAAATAAGHAYITAQAAVDARQAAMQVADPANDAIQLGSPYITSDSAAGLAVLTGQASKTIADQQLAVADAHASHAKDAAAQAQSLANAATGDAKGAYVLAAQAAQHAADARNSAKAALASAADAAKAAADAAATVPRTIDYDKQATADAAAADGAAGRAEGYAKDARASADQAALDADAAQKAAADAKQAAQTARQAADQAERDAEAAEAAAKDAAKQAESAQQAATLAEQEQANAAVDSGAGTGIGHVFYVIDQITPVGDPHQDNPCVNGLGNSGCDVTFTLHYNVTVSFYLCTDDKVPATAQACPSASTVFLYTQTYTNQSKQVTQHYSTWEQTVEFWKNLSKGLWDSLTGDFIRCYHGDATACAWAAAAIVPPNRILEAVQLAREVQAAIQTGVDAEKLLGDLKGIWSAKGAKGDVDLAKVFSIQLSDRLFQRAQAARGPLDMDLVRKLQDSGAKFNQEDLLWAIRYPRPGVPVAWLEKGNKDAGFMHVLYEHAGDFMNRGVATEDIPRLLKTALSDGKIVGNQGADAGRPIYEVTFNGKVQRVGITVGSNGFVVGANPA